MGTARFFASDLPEDGEIFLAGDEAHHMVRVRRQKPGDVVVLFDGRGRWAEARIERFEKAGVTIRILHTHVETPEAGPAITMATAIAKGSRMDFLLEKVAELGAARVVPILTERGVVQGSGEARRTHWQRRLREACKQCGRNVVPELANPATVEELGELLAQSDLALLFDLGPSARPLADVLRERPDAKTILCLIGPEGGFTEQEQGRLTSAGAVPVRLAPTVLRIETAAIAAVAAIVALAKA